MDLVEFPNLGGFRISINRVALEIFNQEIYWYGIIIAISFFIAVTLSIKASRIYNIIPDHIIDVLLFATPSAIICARLYYICFNLESYDSFSDVINIRNGGLAIYGGIIGAITAGYFVCRYKKISFTKMLDLTAPYIVLAQAIGRWGNFVNQEAFGDNTNLPWAMTGNKIKAELEVLQSSGVDINPDLPVHPTFLYESLWNLLVFTILIKYRKNRKVQGGVFFLYMILYGLGRFWIEGLRMDSLMIGPLRVSQVLAISFILVFIIIMIVKKRKLNVIGNVKFGETKYSKIINDRDNK